MPDPRPTALRSTICSACTGAKLTAESGLLDGSAWRDLALYLIVGAATAWHDLALYLIARHVGPATA